MHWQPQTHHNLRRILSELIHHRSFSRALVKPPLGEQYRYDFVRVVSNRPSSFVISLELYFGHVRRFADDDLFVARYLLRQIITLLCQVLSEPDKDWSQPLLGDVTDRMYDSFALLGKLIRDGVLVSPGPSGNQWLSRRLRWPSQQTPLLHHQTRSCCGTCALWQDAGWVRNDMALDCRACGETQHRQG